MGMEIARLKSLGWKNNWDKKFDLHCEDPLKECQTWIRQ